MWNFVPLILGVAAIQCAADGVPKNQEPLQTETSHADKHLHLTHDLLNFHKNLTKIESISYNEKHMSQWLLRNLRSQGYTTEVNYVSQKDARFNVFAYPGSKRDAQLLVTSHIDTVPPFIPYYHDSHDEKIISGRGSVDAKGSVATQVIAVNKLLASGQIQPDDVALLYVVGEEIGGDGMRAANDLKLHPQSIIFGEPTEDKLVSGHKGNLGVHLTAKGKAAHSGYPWLGRSANEVLVKALAALMELGQNLPESEKYGQTTINLGRIEGGVAGNVVSKSAEANIAVRIAEGTPEVIKEEIINAVHVAVQSFLDEDMKAEDVIEIEFASRGYGPIDIDHDVSGFDVMTVNYGTDIPWLDQTVEDQKRYLYGPGSILVAHGDDEALTEEQLFGAVDGYEKIILHALGKSGA